jgi:hypothetical protein
MAPMNHIVAMNKQARCFGSWALKPHNKKNSVMDGQLWA